MKVQLELPDEVDVNPRFVTEALMAVLYSTGKLSARQACQTLNIGRRAFEEMLPKYGFSALVDSSENIEIEISM